ncbi:hypothetical protein [Streptomyces virginiae]
MRSFFVEGRGYVALTVLGGDDFDALEVVEMTAGLRAGWFFGGDGATRTT